MSNYHSVIPAQAGTQNLGKQTPLRDTICSGWVPACAGMTRGAVCR